MIQKMKKKKKEIKNMFKKFFNQKRHKKKFTQKSIIQIRTTITKIGKTEESEIDLPNI